MRHFAPGLPVRSRGARRIGRRGTLAAMRARLALRLLFVLVLVLASGSAAAAEPRIEARPGGIVARDASGAELWAIDHDTPHATVSAPAAPVGPVTVLGR